MEDLFQAAYTAGAPDEVATRPDGPPPRELLARLAPSETVALKGCVLTREDRLDPGHVVIGDGATIAGLDDHLGVLEAGRPADIAVFERVHEDPWESIARSDPAQVDLVLIGGDVAYGRPGFVEALVGRDAAGRYEQEIAWGEPMLLDTGFQAHPGGREIPTLSQLRAALISVYPQVGPICA